MLETWRLGIHQSWQASQALCVGPFQGGQGSSRWSPQRAHTEVRGQVALGGARGPTRRFGLNYSLVCRHGSAFWFLDCGMALAPTCLSCSPLILARHFVCCISHSSRLDGLVSLPWLCRCRSLRCTVLFVGSDFSFTILFHHTVLDDGAPVDTIDASYVKLLRELKTRRQICWYGMVSYPDLVLFATVWWLGLWCAVANCQGTLSVLWTS